MTTKKAIEKEWQIPFQESIDLQRALHDLETPIPELRAIQMGQQAKPSFELMEQTLIHIRVKNNIVTIFRLINHTIHEVSHIFRFN